MRVLVLGPKETKGSLPPYIANLVAGLEKEGYLVAWHGSVGVPYDKENECFLSESDIFDQAESIVSSINLNDFDVISLHYGNLEVEQIIPLLLEGKNHPPVVYHGHTIDPTLFRDQVKNVDTYNKIVKKHYSFQNYVFFGNYARKYFVGNAKTSFKDTVSWLPTTIKNDDLEGQNNQTRNEKPILSLYGFAAPWKDVPSLLEAFKNVTKPCSFELYGPFWDNEELSGLSTLAMDFQIGNVDIKITPDYVGSYDRKSLVSKSDVGIFPYNPHPSFQGSGAIADYLICGKPVIATDVANMAELIGDAGLVVPSNDAASLSKGINYLLEQDNLLSAKSKAQARSKMFATQYHAKQCLDFYKHITLGN